MLGNIARGCSIAAAVGKDEVRTLPRVSATDTNIIGTPIHNLPLCKNFCRQVKTPLCFIMAISNISAIFNLVQMQRRVEVAAVALGNARYRV